ECGAILGSARVEREREPSRLFRRHVLRRAAHADRSTRAALEQRDRWMAGIRTGTTHGEPEVGDACSTRLGGDQDVLGLEIAMEHVAEMRLVNAARHLHHPARYLLDTTRARRRRRRAEHDVTLG